MLRGMAITARQNMMIVSAALLAGFGAQSASAQLVTDKFALQGVIRDFSKTNTNIAATPLGGNGTYSGNIAVEIGSDGRPMFTGAGYKVLTPWLDAQSKVIAPHLYIDKAAMSVGKVLVTTMPTVPTPPPPPPPKPEKQGKGKGKILNDFKEALKKKKAPQPVVVTIDTYNSLMGPYGGANVGAAPAYEVGAAMPELVVPTDLEALPVQKSLRVKKTETKTLTGDHHLKDMSMEGTLVIEGNVRMLFEQRIELEHGQLTLMPDATLTMYLKDGMTIRGNAVIGDPLRPAGVQIMNLAADHNHHAHHKHKHNKPKHHDCDGDDDGMDDDENPGLHGSVRIIRGAMVHAHVTSPKAMMQIATKGAMFGQFTGKTIKFGKESSMHIDTAGGMDPCGNEYDDKVGTKGVASTGGIPSAEGFNQWYNDVLGVNLSMPHTLLLGRNPANTQWQFINDAFWPIDKKLMGNENQAHNNYFTWTATAHFVHHACADTFVEFMGKDDMWIFIDGKLALDRGGVLPTLTHHIDMDRLGLQDGQTYTMHLFYAQRNAAASQFRLFTNVQLVPPPSQQMMMVQFSGPQD